MSKKRNKPNVFIIGAAKSGTTSLREWLGQHPDVFTIKIEPCFFCNDIEDYRGINNVNWYLHLFDKADNKKCIIDKSAFYIYSKEAPKRIKKFSPKAKIIAILRDPIEQMKSNHNHLYLEGKEPIRDFHKALAAEEERKRKSKYLERFFYRDVANYKPQIERYKKEFGKKNVLVLNFNDLKNKPKKTYLKTLKFIGLKKFEPDYSPQNIGQNKTKRPLRHLIIFANKLPWSLKKILKIIKNNTFLKKIFENKHKS